MAWDPATNQVVLFGGLHYACGDCFEHWLSDTWTWDGATWTRQQPAASPPRMASASLAFDPATRQLVLFGGARSSGATTRFFGQTWTWDGTTWKELPPAGSPPPREEAGLAFDPVTRGLILLGGFGRHER